MKRVGTYGVLVLGLVLVGAALWMLRGSSDEGNKPAAPAAPPAKVESAVPSAVLPSFDIVRISPEGDTVIAGRAAPGATVVIYDGDTELGRAKADERGEWVFLPEKPLPPGTRRLNLAVFPDADPAHALRSESDVVLVVPPPGTGAVVAVQLPGKGGVSRVLQRPGDAAAGLSIAAVDYDRKGSIGVSGGADPGAMIVVYLDNAELGQTAAAANGDWRLQANVSLSEGVHAVRADQLDAKGGVAKRVEVSFRVDAADAAVDGNVIVVVQPGNSLWRIARRIYGEGLAYTLIFEANRGQIRDPDLIYPGQKFVAPKK
ncbi:MAG: LysM peptidoglycan-binding domain-containing protein [Rhodospirillaceae bacterium]